MLSEAWSDGNNFKVNIVLKNRFSMVHQLIVELFKGHKRAFRAYIKHRFLVIFAKTSMKISSPLRVVIRTSKFVI